jgi:hypothetical protein
MSAAKISFDQLLTLLPNCPGPAKLSATGGEAIPHYVPKTPTDFTAPSLSSGGDAAPPLAPQIIVVSAAGAVGKSTLAREISRVKGSPYWDLAKARTVGAGSPIGELTEAFTAAQLGNVLSDIRSGNLFVVIDALDEARLKVNETAFLDFLSNLANLTVGGAGVGFILFGRTQIAETALAWLDLINPKPTTAHYTIDFFDRPRADANFAGLRRARR